MLPAATCSPGGGIGIGIGGFPGSMRVFRVDVGATEGGTYDDSADQIFLLTVIP